jgi:hypothetical protein
MFLVLGRVYWLGVIAVDVSLLDLNVCECVLLPVGIFGVEDYAYIMDLMLFEECGEFVGKIVLVDSLAMGVGCVLVEWSVGVF